MARRDRSRLRGVNARRITLLLSALAVLAILARLELAVPPDTDTWSPGMLQGEVVHAVLETPDAILAGSQSGLHELFPDGSAERISGIPGPVYAVYAHRSETYAATEDGVYTLPADGEPPRREGPTGVAVNGVTASDSRTYAATDDGLFERGQGGWERAWTRTANTVLAVEGGAVVGSPEGIFRVEEDGGAERVWSGGTIEGMGSEGGSFWAGVRGEPRLLVSHDSGRSWEPLGNGILLEAVNALAADPNDAEGLFVGGSGLADGENLAGVMASDDGGANWEAGQNRLSNTHVFALAARREPMSLEVSLPPVFTARALDLPFEMTRFYAGTNGSGVHTYRPAPRSLATLASIHPAMRLAEPVLAGLVVLVLAWKMYFGQTRKRAGDPSEQAHTK